MVVDKEWKPQTRTRGEAPAKPCTKYKDVGILTISSQVRTLYVPRCPRTQCPVVRMPDIGGLGLHSFGLGSREMNQTHVEVGSRRFLHSGDHQQAHRVIRKAEALPGRGARRDDTDCRPSGKHG